MKTLILLFTILYNQNIFSKGPFYNFKWPKNEFPLEITCSLTEVENLEVKNSKFLKKIKDEGIPNLNYKIKFPTPKKGELKFSRGFLGEHSLSLEIKKQVEINNSFNYVVTHVYLDEDAKLIDKGEDVYDFGKRKLGSYFITPKGGFVRVICLIKYIGN